MGQIIEVRIIMDSSIQNRHRRQQPTNNEVRHNYSNWDLDLSDDDFVMSSSSTTLSSDRVRQQSVSDAFAALRYLLPVHPPDKKLSKCDILRLAIRYIDLLDSLVKDL